MKNFPLVHVLMATYNGEQYIEQQIDSILNQTYPNITLIIADDASTDHTPFIVEKYLSTSEKIVFLQNEVRLGYAKNFEYLLQYANGSYFALSDQDDIWESNKIALCMEAMLLKEDEFPDKGVMIHSDLKMIDANGELIHPSYAKYRGYHFQKSKDVATMISRCGVMGNTILLNNIMKELVIPFHTNIVHHDYWIAVINELFGVRVTLKEKLVAYRIHNDNASNKMTLIHQKRRFHLKKLLPYRDNNRYELLKGILTSYNLEKSDKRTVILFLHYLRAQKDWIQLYPIMIKEGFFRHGFYSHSKLIGKLMIASVRHRHQDRV